MNAMSVKLPEFIFAEETLQNPHYFTAFARLLHVSAGSAGTLCMPRQQLAAVLGLGSRGTLNNLLERLEQKGYLKSVPIAGVGTQVSIINPAQYWARGSRAVSPAKRAAFAAPSVDEVRAYCAEKGYTIDPQDFADYYTQRNWTWGKNNTPMTDWKRAVATWQKNNFQKIEPFDPLAPRNDKQRFFEWLLRNALPEALKAEGKELQALWRANKRSIDGLFALCGTLRHAEEITAFAVNQYRARGVSWNLSTIVKNGFSLREQYDSERCAESDRKGAQL